MLGAVPDVEGRAPEPEVAAWARECLARLTALPGVHRAGLALAEGGGRRLWFTASDRGGATVGWCHVDAYDALPLNTAVRTGRPVFGRLDDLEERYAAFVARQNRTPTTALAAVPLAAGGRVLGGIVLFFDTAEPLGRSRRSRLTDLGLELAAGLLDARRHRGPEITLAREPVPVGAAVAFHDVEADPAAVGAARRFLRRTLEEWGVDDDVSDAAALCLSEVVTNALIHTPAGAAVRLLLDDGVLTTTVRDGGTPGTASIEPLEDPLRVHGRGLQLVDAVSTRWGSVPGHSGAGGSVGTTVWFELAAGT
jgi:anti-sigma regulatory factor (Ser/Thr protein kinase)